MPESLKRFRRGIGQIGLLGLGGAGLGAMATYQSQAGQANWAWAVGTTGVALASAFNVLASWMRSRENRDGQERTALVRRVNSLELNLRRVCDHLGIDWVEDEE